MPLFGLNITLNDSSSIRPFYKDAECDPTECKLEVALSPDQEFIGGLCVVDCTDRPYSRLGCR